MESKMKDLGWMNGWKEVPVEVQNCTHDWKSGKKTEADHRRCYTKVTCEVCGYYYEIDSSG